MNVNQSPLIRLHYTAWLWRIPLLTLMIVETASVLHLIDVQPSFTASGLLLQATVFYVFFESLFYWIRTRHQRIPPWWIAGSLIGLVILDALGDYLDWYTTVPGFDAYLHFLLPAAAVTGFWGLRRSLGLPTTYRYLFFTVAPCVTTIGALYEIEEYLEDLWTGSHRLGDGFDTANDLLMDLLGSIFPIMVAYLYHRCRRLIQRG